MPSVRELTVPLAVDVPDGAAVPDLVTAAARDTPEHVQLRRRRGDSWQDVTCRELLDEVCAVARGMVAAGVGAGDRVGIMSRTRAEWTVADLATWFAGAVPVPVYETSSAEQVAWVLGDSGAVGCFVESRAHADLVATVRDRLPGLHEVWVLDDGVLDDLTTAGAERRRRRAGGPARDAARRLAGDAHLHVGDDRPAEGLRCSRTATCSPAPATRSPSCEGVFDADSSTLLFLPLAHVFARVIEVGCLASGVALSHAPDTTTLLSDLAQSRPTFILSVPRVFEKVFNGAQAKARAESKGRVFDKASAHAIAYSRALDTEGGPGLPLRVQHAVYDRFVFSRLREALGGAPTPPSPAVRRWARGWATSSAGSA